MRMDLQFCQSTSFFKVIVESNFAELIDLLNSDRIYSLEVAWILENINFICDSFYFVFFVSIP